MMVILKILAVIAFMAIVAVLYWRCKIAPIFLTQRQQEQSQYQKHPVMFSPDLLYQMKLNSKYAKNMTFIRTVITNVSSMSWHQVHESQLSHLKTVIIYDNGPCFWVATGRSAKNGSGGESIWCSSIIGQLLDQDRYVYVTVDPSIAMILTMNAHQYGHGVITIAHWGWRHIAISKTPLPQHLRNPPLAIMGGIDCILKMNYWGTKVPTELWPGNLKHYISPYPLLDNHVDGCRGSKEEGGYNTAIGFGDQFLHCGDEEFDFDSIAMMFPPNTTTTHSMDNINTINNTDMMIWDLIRNNRSYYVIYGKFGNFIPTKLIDPMFANELLWTILHEEMLLQGIILTCDDSLFPVLRTTSTAFICLEETSVFRDRPWYPHLLHHAVFVMGLGHPKLSTSPFDALACHTHVILPVGMHTFLERTSRCNPSKRLHIVKNIKEILYAANVSLQQHHDQQMTKRLDGGEEKEMEDDEDMMGFVHMKDDFLQLVEEVENQCRNRVGMRLP